MKDWHREDIISALLSRPWDARERQAREHYFVGESLFFSRNESRVRVTFIADLGEGFTGLDSLEEAVAESGSTSRLLWLSRRRDSKWRAALAEWADGLARDEA